MLLEWLSSRVASRCSLQKRPISSRRCLTRIHCATMFETMAIVPAAAPAGTLIAWRSSSYRMTFPLRLLRASVMAQLRVATSYRPKPNAKHIFI
uniref:Secreted protein n=1 Tax=Panagrellus redivivus TaxID=6233 RepID=A0A7E4UNV7_PANRE